MAGNTPWCRNDSDILYLQKGQFTSTILATYDAATALGANCWATAIDMDTENTPWGFGPVFSYSDRIYLLQGHFTSTILDSLGLGISWSMYGCSYDNYYTYITYNTTSTGHLVKFNGQFTAVIADTIDVTTHDKYPRGISVDNAGNIIFAGDENDTLYCLQGRFSSTLLDSQDVSATAQPTNIGYDGTDTVWCGGQYLYLQDDKFNSTILASYYVGSAYPTGISNSDFCLRTGEPDGEVKCESSAETSIEVSVTLAYSIESESEIPSEDQSIILESESSVETIIEVSPAILIDVESESTVEAPWYSNHCDSIIESEGDVATTWEEYTTVAHDIESEADATPVIYISLYFAPAVESESEVVQNLHISSKPANTIESENEVVLSPVFSFVVDGIIESEGKIEAEATRVSTVTGIIPSESDVTISPEISCVVLGIIQSAGVAETSVPHSYTVSGIIKSEGQTVLSSTLSYTGNCIIESESLVADDYTGETLDTTSLVLTGSRFEPSMFTQYGFDSLVEDSSGNYYVAGESGIYILGHTEDITDTIHSRIVCYADDLKDDHNKTIRSVEIGNKGRYSTIRTGSGWKTELVDDICKRVDGSKHFGSRARFGKVVGYDIEDFDEIGVTELEVVTRT